MADERLKDFPSKITPIEADIIYVGDSENNFNEVQSSVGEIIAGYSDALVSIAGLTTAADKMIYTTDTNTYETTTLTTFARTLLADTSATTFKASLGLIGTFNDINIQRFVASATYTPSSGTVFALVRIQAGGGGGGGGYSGATQNGGGGGGSGGYAEKLLNAGAIGSSQVVLIGAGGTVGTTSATAPTAGGVGGDTSFGAIFTVSGGLAGAAASASGAIAVGGDGGGASTGDFFQVGATGSNGFPLSGLAGIGGAGGVSRFGGGAVGGEVAYRSVGAGGGAGTNTQNGGPGGVGYCEVIEFISA